MAPIAPVYCALIVVVARASRVHTLTQRLFALVDRARIVVVAVDGRELARVRLVVARIHRAAALVVAIVVVLAIVVWRRRRSG